MLVIEVTGFLLLVAVLAALRTRLVYELSAASLLLLGTPLPGQVLYSILVLPGTIVHELSHWLVAEILQVRTGKIVILPELGSGGGTRRLGSVEAEKTDPFRGFLIGLAPFISGLAILFTLSRLLALWWGSYPWWSLALVIYGIMVVGNSMLISSEDRRTWPVVIALAGLLAYALGRAGVTVPLGVYPWLTSVLESLNLVLGVTAGFNLVMILGSHLVRRLLERVTKRRIL